MTMPSGATATFVQKLEQFTSALTPEEREVLGEILLHAVNQEQSAADVQGYAFSFGTSSVLGPSILQAQQSGKTFTNIFLQPGPVGQIHLGIAGPAARSL
jgi:hypothetical protein